MIRFKIAELIARKGYVESRRLSLQIVADELGVSRVTLSKLLNQQGYSTGTDIVNTLCAYFGCAVQDLLEYFPDRVADAYSPDQEAPLLPPRGPEPPRQDGQRLGQDR